MANKKRKGEAASDADRLGTALEKALSGHSAFSTALQHTTALDIAVRSSHALDTVSRMARGIDENSGFSALNAARGIYGPNSSFSALSEASQRIQQSHDSVFARIADITHRAAMPTFEIPIAYRNYAFADLSGIESFQNSMTRISAAITSLLEASRPTIDFSRNWHVTLPERLYDFRPNWSTAEPEFAVLEFGRLAHLSDVVHVEAPYAPSVSEYLAEELENPPADAAEEENGFEIFAEHAIPSVTLAAGFLFTVPMLPPSTPDDGTEFDGVFDPGHHSILTDIEQRLRRIIVDELTKYDGADWKRKVPAALIEKWSIKQELDRERGIQVLGLIHYSDFGELADIITSRGNWANAFSLVFKGQQEIAMSLRHLSPIRNAIAHSRPLSKLEAIWLVAEATRLYIQLGIPVVNILR